MWNPHASRERPSMAHASVPRLVPGDARRSAGWLGRLHALCLPPDHVDVPVRVMVRAEPPDPRSCSHAARVLLRKRAGPILCLVMLAVCMQRDSDPKHGGISPDSHYLPAALDRKSAEQV